MRNMFNKFEQGKKNKTRKTTRKNYYIKCFVAGIFRGIGTGIGFTIFTAILIIVLQKIVALNIPVIGEYIADIVNIVEKKI